jgi:transposase
LGCDCVHKNRERLLDGDIAEAFFQGVLQQARERGLLTDEHFTVDGTLLEAWASAKSYQRNFRSLLRISNLAPSTIPILA